MLNFTNLYEKVIALCEEQNIPFSKLAKHLNYSEEHLASLLTGETCASQREIKLVADFFNLSVKDLLFTETTGSLPSLEGIFEKNNYAKEIVES